MDKGSFVTLLAAGEEQITRRVVLDEGDTLLVCTDSEYRQAETDGREPACMRFNKRYIVSEALTAAEARAS